MFALQEITKHVRHMTTSYQRVALVTSKEKCIIITDIANMGLFTVTTSQRSIICLHNDLTVIVKAGVPVSSFQFVH